MIKIKMLLNTSTSYPVNTAYQLTALVGSESPKNSFRPDSRAELLMRFDGIATGLLSCIIAERLASHEDV